MAGTAEKLHVPSEEDARLAGESIRALADEISEDGATRVQILDAGGKGTIVALPNSAMRLFVDLLEHMARGDAIKLVAVNSELTTQEAADLLNVSRPFLTNLLKSNAIPYRMVGTHRRVLARDVLSYKQSIDAKRRAVLDQLAREAQELGMGY